MRILFAAALATVLAAAVLAPRGHSAAAGACPPPPPQPTRHLLTRPTWLKQTLVTEYWPASERWFAGKLVHAPGIAGMHPVDWLYGAHGLPMEGEGLARGASVVHFAGPYDIGWVNRRGGRTQPCRTPGAWTNGRPFWLASGWRSRAGRVTWPLARGGWSNGRGVRFSASRARFATGHSRTLAYWKSAAVDPKVIPFGSRIFLADLCRTPAHGWLEARDTGGAIGGHHIDVYRPPPARLAHGLNLHGRAILVVPPGTRPRRYPRCT